MTQFSLWKKAYSSPQLRALDARLPPIEQILVIADFLGDQANVSEFLEIVVPMLRTVHFHQPGNTSVTNAVITRILGHASWMPAIVKSLQHIRDTKRPFTTLKGAAHAANVSPTTLERGWRRHCQACTFAECVRILCLARFVDADGTFAERAARCGCDLRTLRHTARLLSDCTLRNVVTSPWTIVLAVDGWFSHPRFSSEASSVSTCAQMHFRASGVWKTMSEEIQLSSDLEKR
jgi:hypothetical protein